MYKHLQPRAISSEFLRFLCVGAFNTAFGWALYWLLLEVFSYRWAYTLAYGAGVWVSYLLNCHLVFRRKPTLGGALGFPIVYVVQYGLGLVLLSALVEGLRWDRRFAPIAVAAATTPVTFALSRTIVRLGGRRDAPL